MEVLKTFLLAFLGGAGGVALINAIHDRWKWKAERKAAKEDKKDDTGEMVKKHDAAIKENNEELALLTFGILACLKGVKELGANGPVTEAINKIEKHLNEKAHGG